MSAESILAIAMVACLLTMGAVCVLLFQLIASQGRLLSRIDRLHELVTMVAQGEQPARLPDAKALQPGTELPAFRLTAVTGEEVGSDRFKGKALVIVNWSTGCGYCSVIARQLSTWAATMRDRGGQLILVSDNNVDANAALVKQHGFTGTVLLRAKSNGEPVFFRGVPTPAAYWVDDTGRVVKPLAIGADEVPMLAREAATGVEPPKPVATKPLSESKIVRDGLPPGSPAPDFRVPTTAGGEVALSEYRGQRVLLVFSDPNCSPCDSVASVLSTWHREGRSNGLGLLMVGRGDFEQNKRKAIEQGIEFPVGVQTRWEVSRLYGIFVTPAAFLIAEDGTVAAPVMTGPDEIISNLGLARAVGAV